MSAPGEQGAANGRLRPRKCSVLGTQPPNIKRKSDKTTKPTLTRKKAKDKLNNEKVKTNLHLKILCPFCPKRFASKKSQAKHNATVHGPRGELACQFCGAREVDAARLLRHLTERHAAQYHACVPCRARFPSPAARAAHACRAAPPSPDRNPIVISCELKPQSREGGADIEDSIAASLIVPSHRPLPLDELAWAAPDQVLSRLGVVHRSPRAPPPRARDDSAKFERCFDTGFYAKVAGNVQENLNKFLEGSFNRYHFDPENAIKTRKPRNNIHTAEGFPILLAGAQVARGAAEPYSPRPAPRRRWKWGSGDGERSPAPPDAPERDSHASHCIITLVSGLDIWTQLRMRRKYDAEFHNSSFNEKRAEKQNVISNELKEILESRELPTPARVPPPPQPAAPAPRPGLEFPLGLGLRPAAPARPPPPPAVLSGEWARARRLVCNVCGARAGDAREWAAHAASAHPRAALAPYEVVGEHLLRADILQQLSVRPRAPPAPAAPPAARPLRSNRYLRDCTKCGQSVAQDDLHEHMVACAGDAPAPRRRARPRPFGVRRRRPRAPPARVDRRVNRTNHIRPRPNKNKVRTEVGDAETIRKMLADLPPKRHRVVVSSANPSLRPRRGEQARPKGMMKRRPSTHDKARQLRSRRAAGGGAGGEPAPALLRDEHRRIGKQPRALRRPPLARQAKRRPAGDHPDPARAPAAVPVTTLAGGASSQRASTGGSSGSSAGGSGSSSGEGQQSSRGGGGGGQRDGSQGAGGGRGPPPPSPPPPPPPNPPLKHSIARLTAVTETKDKAVQFQPHFLVQQECSQSARAPAAPPAPRRKGLNACIAMLKNKLDDPPGGAEGGGAERGDRRSVQCDTSDMPPLREPLYRPRRLQAPPATPAPPAAPASLAPPDEHWPPPPKQAKTTPQPPPAAAPPRPLSLVPLQQLVLPPPALPPPRPPQYSPQLLQVYCPGASPRSRRRPSQSPSPRLPPPLSPQYSYMDDRQQSPSQLASHMFKTRSPLPPGMQLSPPELMRNPSKTPSPQPARVSPSQRARKPSQSPSPQLSPSVARRPSQSPSPQAARPPLSPSQRARRPSQSPSPQPPRMPSPSHPRHGPEPIPPQYVRILPRPPSPPAHRAPPPSSQPALRQPQQLSPQLLRQPQQLSPQPITRQPEPTSPLPGIRPHPALSPQALMRPPLQPSPQPVTRQPQAQSPQPAPRPPHPSPVALAPRPPVQLLPPPPPPPPLVMTALPRQPIKLLPPPPPPPPRPPAAHRAALPAPPAAAPLDLSARPAPAPAQYETLDLSNKSQDRQPCDDGQVVDLCIKYHEPEEGVTLDLSVRRPPSPPPAPRRDYPDPQPGPSRAPADHPSHYAVDHNEPSDYKPYRPSYQPEQFSHNQRILLPDYQQERTKPHQIDLSKPKHVVAEMSATPVRQLELATTPPAGAPPPPARLVDHIDLTGDADDDSVEEVAPTAIPQIDLVDEPVLDNVKPTEAELAQNIKPDSKMIAQYEVAMQQRNIKVLNEEGASTSHDAADKLSNYDSSFGATQFKSEQMVGSGVGDGSAGGDAAPPALPFPFTLIPPGAAPGGGLHASLDTATMELTVTLSDRAPAAPAADPHTQIILPITSLSDLEAAKKIAMLPKEIVDIVSKMPPDTRNQLLNVLPQYLMCSTALKQLRLVVELAGKETVVTPIGLAALQRPPGQAPPPLPPQPAPAQPPPAAAPLQPLQQPPPPPDAPAPPTPAPLPDLPLAPQPPAPAPLPAAALPAAPTAAKSEIATQTSNGSFEETCPPDFINIDTERYLIDPYTGDISARLQHGQETAETSAGEQPPKDTERAADQEPPVKDEQNASLPAADDLKLNLPNENNFIAPIPARPKPKEGNEKTSSLRAVRIKTLERRKSLQHVPLPNKNPDPTVNMATVNTTVSADSLPSKALAIQQAEVSSTEHAAGRAAPPLPPKETPQLPLTNKDRRTSAEIDSNVKTQSDKPTNIKASVTTSVSAAKKQKLSIVEKENVETPDKTVEMIEKTVKTNSMQLKLTKELVVSIEPTTTDILRDAGNNALLNVVDETKELPKEKDIKVTEDEDSDDDISLAIIVKQKKLDNNGPLIKPTENNTEIRHKNKNTKKKRGKKVKKSNNIDSQNIEENSTNVLKRIEKNDDAIPEIINSNHINNITSEKEQRVKQVKNIPRKRRGRWKKTKSFSQSETDEMEVPKDKTVPNKPEMTEELVLNGNKTIKPVISNQIDDKNLYKVDNMPQLSIDVENHINDNTSIDKPVTSSRPSPPTQNTSPDLLNPSVNLTSTTLQNDRAKVTQRKTKSRKSKRNSKPDLNMSDEYVDKQPAEPTLLTNDPSEAALDRNKKDMCKETKEEAVRQPVIELEPLPKEPQQVNFNETSETNLMDCVKKSKDRDSPALTASNYRSSPKLSDELNLPLRRSRRGKSIYVDTTTAPIEIEPPEVVVENRGPFTKKQLIFSKLLDEEKHLKAMEVAPDTLDERPKDTIQVPVASSDPLPVTTVDAGYDAYIFNDDEEDEVIRPPKPSKRKKSPQTKLTRKKKKSFESQNILDSEMSSSDDLPIIPKPLKAVSKLADSPQILTPEPAPSNELMDANKSDMDITNDITADSRKDFDDKILTNSHLNQLKDSDINPSSTVDEDDDDFIEVKSKKTKAKRRGKKVSEKRKNTKLFSDSSSIDSQVLKKPKKNEETVIDAASTEVKKQDADKPEVAKAESTVTTPPAVKTTPCYDMPRTENKARSKSFLIKPIMDDAYDPYDIDMEEKMLQDIEPLLKKAPISLRHAPVPEPKVTKTIPKRTSSLSSSDENAATVTSTSDAAAPPPPPPPAPATNGRAQSSDTDDSSKSDVPLKKIAEEKHKNKKPATPAATPPTNHVSDDHDIEKPVISDITTVANEVEGPKENKTETDKEIPKKKGAKGKGKRPPPAEAAPASPAAPAPAPGSSASADERRSEQFMESFGFFSERKPRKSNLAATKKIAETFHSIANDELEFNARSKREHKKREHKKSTSTSDEAGNENSHDKNTEKTKEQGKKKLTSDIDNAHVDVGSKHKEEKGKEKKKELRKSLPSTSHEGEPGPAPRQERRRSKRESAPATASAQDSDDDENENLLSRKKRSVLTSSSRHNKPPEPEPAPRSPRGAGGAGPCRDLAVPSTSGAPPPRSPPRRLSLSDSDSDLELCSRPLTDAERAAPRDPAVYCALCDKEFRRPDNLLRHRLSVPHLTMLLREELGVPVPPAREEPKYLLVYKQHMQRLQRATERRRRRNRELGIDEEVRLPLPAPAAVLADARRRCACAELRLSSDEQLFLRCCQMLKGPGWELSPEPPAPPAPAPGPAPPDDGDVDSVTAQDILESDEVKNLENDLILGLKESLKVTAGARTAQLKRTEECLHPRAAPAAEPAPAPPVPTAPPAPAPAPADQDVFEDKFDIIKRKRRSQAAAARAAPAPDPVSSHKNKKKAEKKKARRNSKKNQSSIPTKGALKGFDGIRVSIRTGDMNLSLPAPRDPRDPPRSPDPPPRKRKKNSKRRRPRPAPRAAPPAPASPRRLDVYDFQEEEASCSLRPRRPPTPDDPSDPDDHVYMSEEYTGSADETDSRLSAEPPRRRPDKSAAVGRIFKQTAQRRAPAPRAAPAADLDQLFDALLEGEAPPPPAPPHYTNDDDDSLLAPPLLSRSPPPSPQSPPASPPPSPPASPPASPPGSPQSPGGSPGSGSWARGGTLARGRARRTCTVGKQNVLAESWSSESEGERSGSGGRRRRRRPPPARPRVSPLAPRPAPAPPAPPPAPPSSDEEAERPPAAQHGWIVGASHKKLLTMLAHAKRAR